jgi:hypothetical protein
MAWSWENAGGGALTGAAVGTMVAPGIGTAVGAAGGGLIGGMGGFGDIFSHMTGQTSTQNQYSDWQADSAAKQSKGLSQIGNWALTGEGPSAAQSLVQMNREQNAANMIGSAKSMPGGNPALSNQLAAEGISRGNAAATLQGAQIRSAEQQAMIDNYMTGLQAKRGQDIQMYEAKLAAEQKNTAGKQGFIGGILSGAGGGFGGMMG